MSAARYLIFSHVGHPSEQRQVSLDERSSLRQARATRDFWKAHGYPEAKIYDFKTHKVRD